MLALSATPGASVAATQAVVANLLISRLECRSETSPDVSPYVQNRSMEKVRVPISPALVRARELLYTLIRQPIDALVTAGVFHSKDPKYLTKGALHKAFSGFKDHPPNDVAPSSMFTLSAQFGMAISLLHGKALLEGHGLSSFRKYVDGLATKEQRESVRVSPSSHSSTFAACHSTLRF